MDIDVWVCVCCELTKRRKKILNSWTLSIVRMVEMTVKHHKKRKSPIIFHSKCFEYTKTVEKFHFVPIESRGKISIFRNIVRASVHNTFNIMAVRWIEIFVLKNTLTPFYHHIQQNNMANISTPSQIAHFQNEWCVSVESSKTWIHLFFFFFFIYPSTFFFSPSQIQLRPFIFGSCWYT